MLEQLLERFRLGDRRALSRLLSLAGRGESLEEVAAALRKAECRQAKVIAFTGSGGVGKSTLLGKLIDVVLASDAQGSTHRIAVLACDPQSPLSGGALLGDRFRMGNHDDDRLFLRSLAALSGHSALADHLPVMVRLLECFGFDVVFLETVGAGQGDTAVRALADVVVLLLQPETGDDLQWEKAGVLEVADIVVIHKADLPGAEQTAAQVRAAMELSTQRAIPLISVSSKTERGHEDLWTAIEACPSRRDQQSAAHEVLRLAQEELAARFGAAIGEPHVKGIVESWQQGKISVRAAAAQLLSYLVENQNNVAS